MNNTNHVDENVMKFASCQSLVGLSSSVITLMIYLFKKQSWDIFLFINILLPFFVFSLFYFGIYFYVKKHYDVSIPYVRQTMKHIFIALVVVFVGLNAFMIFYAKNREIPVITLSSLQKTIRSNAVEEYVFAIFTSTNCIYCHQMKPIYNEASHNVNPSNLFYVDLSYMSTDDVWLSDQHIEEIPLLVLYHNGKEFDRLSGTASRDAVIDFFLKEGN